VRSLFIFKPLVKMSIRLMHWSYSVYFSQVRIHLAPVGQYGEEDMVMP
jgi:hypothetical protein